MKNYCFHPERVSGKLVANVCVYDWLNKAIDEKSSKILIRENEPNASLVEQTSKIRASKMLALGSAGLVR